MIKGGHMLKGKVIHLDGYRLHYIEEGRGKPLLLVHGLGSYHYTWRHNIKALAAHYHVFAVDLKGFGYSDKPKGPGYSIDHHAQSVRDFMDALGLQKAHYLGSSMGGEIGMRLCLESPRLIDKLILVGSSGYRDWLPLSIRILCRLPYKYIVRPFIKRKYLTKQVLKQFVQAAFYNPSAISDEELEQYLIPMNMEDFDLCFLALLREFDFGKKKKDYHRILHETLILAGEKDVVITHKDSLQLARDLKNSTMITIPKTGHFMHEERPHTVNRIILDFLSMSPGKEGVEMDDFK